VTTNSTTPTIISPTITNVSKSNLNATISVNTGSCSGTICYSIISASEYSSATTHYGDSGSTTSNPFTVTVPSAGSYYFQVNMKYNGTWYYSNAVGPYSFTAPITYGYCYAPTIIDATFNNGFIIVNWSGAQGGTNNSITGYSVGYTQTSSQPSSSTAPTSSTTTISTTSTEGTTWFSELTPGLNYCFSVRTLGTVSGYHS